MTLAMVFTMRARSPTSYALSKREDIRRTDVVWSPGRAYGSHPPVIGEGMVTDLTTMVDMFAILAIGFQGEIV